MFYWKCTGEIEDDDTIKRFNEEDYRLNKKIEHNIQKITEKQFSSGGTFIFLSVVDYNRVIFGAITESINNFKSKFDRYLESIKINLINIEIDEVTLKEITYLYEDSICENYSKRGWRLYDYFGIESFQNNFMCRDYNERLIKENCKSKIYRKAERLYICNTLVPELDRIYEGKVLKNAKGHPVHYLIQADDMKMLDGSIDILTEALYENNRISGKRVTYADYSFSSRYRYNQIIDEIDELYLSCIGTTVVIKFITKEEYEDSYSSSIRHYIEVISKTINKYCNDVLTILCFPKECSKLKGWLYEYLGNISIVELKEELVSASEARKVLNRRAKEHNVRTDKKLLAKIDDDKSYLLKELDNDFDEWYCGKLKSSVYPQYQCIETVTNKKARENPKGTSYEELNKLIGLKEAKKVIDQALDYYKFQKLFKDKGVDQGNLSRHMVFTGNPGTAKTTVARMFANVMRDNGVLSTGVMVEVGRSDLVGKYVGWTAPTVKRKFEDAKGGVLFIDEAYSLVDDRDGLYGDEAINTIVQEMENHRDEVIVIFAGYPDKMEGFLKKNPGLRSRIAFHVPFEDYDVDDLCQIAELMAENKGLSFTRDAVEKLRENFAIAKEQPDFGNGRYVRNVIEKARMAQASRLLKMNVEELAKDDLMTFCAEDIELPKIKKDTRVKFGFCT
ncbi:ATPase family associated with various cellular activities (AAA) [Lachnospiraceae bacterium NE2001]|nr:ATPase family associated with various cellular activities (AAA) [Lachnospiraceae bacterium NE2001]